MNMHTADKHNNSLVQKASAQKTRLGFMGVFFASLLGTLVAVLMSGGALVIAKNVPGLYDPVPVVWKAVQSVVARLY